MDDQNTPTQSRLTRGRIAGTVTVFLSLAAIVLVPTIRYHTNHVVTDDAYISGNLVTVSSRITARIDSLKISTGDTVDVGQTIVVLDDRPFLAELAKATAEVASARSQLAEEEIALTREKHNAGPMVEQYVAEWTASKARLMAAQAALEQAERSLRRAERLSKSLLISESELERYRIDAQRRKAEHEEAGEQVTKAAAGVRMTDGHLHPVRIQHQKVETARAHLTLAETAVQQSQIRLAETRVHSPVRGILAKTVVNDGELADEGQTLAFIHDLDSLWVIANVEETQISLVSIGQPVEITIDAWADTTLTGKVEKIGSVTSSQFAVIPRENLGGNFVKVVQRIPIRISVRNPGRRLKLGLSATVGIDIRE